MSFLPSSPWDYVTSTDKHGKVRFDPRKSFEWGSYWVSTTWGSVLLYQGKFTEWFFVGYMAVWTGARYLRDREQRLSNAPTTRQKPDNPDR